MNPTTEIVTLVLPGTGKFTVELYSITGALVKAWQVEGKEKTTLSIPGPKGIYLLRISENNGQPQVVRLVKQ